MDSDYEIFDDRFRKLVNGSAKLHRLYDKCHWAEGPAWFGGGRYLVWSDAPNDRILRYDETDDSVSVFRQPSNNTNGNTMDRQGRLISCEHGTRRVTRTEHDGAITVLADRFDGKRFNSPNDVVVKSDGTIWFTDPAYGIDNDYEGFRSEPELDGCHVYRIATDGAVSRVADDFVRPNGLAFSPGEEILYIADTGRTHGAEHPAHIRKFAVSGATLSGGEIFASCDVGLFDGFRVDRLGNVWTSAGDGVRCYHPDGTLIGRVNVPEPVANVCFGGAKHDRLFIAATTSLYSVRLFVNGAQTYRPAGM